MFFFFLNFRQSTMFQILSFYIIYTFFWIGEIRKNETLVIGMIHSEGGKRNAVSNYIGNAENQLKLITIHYKGGYPTSSPANEGIDSSIQCFFN